MKKLCGFILVLVLALSLAGCGGNPIATVNGVKISEDDYQDYLENILAIYAANGVEFSDEELVQLKEYVIDELVYQETVLQAAEELGVTPTKKETQTYFEEQLIANYGDVDTGLDLIDSVGVDEEFFYNNSFLTLAQEKIAENLVPESTLTDEEAEALYDEDPDSWNTREVSHILIAPVSTSDTTETDENGYTIYTDEEWATAKADAEDIISQLDDGADFAELAADYSSDTTTASNGGALGSAFTREDSGYVEEFAAAAFELKNVGDYTAEPVKTDYGYHIILLTAKQDSSDMDALLLAIKETKLEEERESAFSEFLTTKQSEAVVERFDEEEAADESAADEETDDTSTEDTTDTTTEESATE